MKTSEKALKIIFWFIILIFSLALAYFAVSVFLQYLSLSRWATLIIFAAVYVLIGMMVSKVFAVSLALLFSADVLILDVLGNNYEVVPLTVKTILVIILLVLLYVMAILKFSEKEKIEGQQLS